MGDVPHYFINKSSWHYRYYSWVRKQYLGQQDTKEATSICPYFHTMVWGSMGVVLTLPLVLFSAVGLRLLRWVLKRNNPLIDWIDSKTPVGMLAKEGREVLEDRPVVGAITSGAGLIFTLAFLFFSLAGLCSIVYYSPQILSGMFVGIKYIALGFLCVGWFIFCLFGYVAWTLEWIGYGIKVATLAVGDFLANGAMWWTILVYVLYAIVGIFALSIVGLASWGISKLSFMQRFGSWVTMRVNGYEEQKELRKHRLRECKIKEEATHWQCSYCGGITYTGNIEFARRDSKVCFHCGKRNPNIPYSIWERISSWLDGRKKEIRMPRRSVWVSLGFMSSISAGLWAIKHRVCPALTFVTDEELQQQVQEAVAVDDNNDLAKRSAGIYNDVECPECGRELNIEGLVVGQTIKCSSCEHLFVAPKPKTAVEIIHEKADESNN